MPTKPAPASATSLAEGFRRYAKGRRKTKKSAAPAAANPHWEDVLNSLSYPQHMFVTKMVELSDPKNNFSPEWVSKNAATVKQLGDLFTDLVGHYHLTAPAYLPGQEDDYFFEKESSIGTTLAQLLHPDKQTKGRYIKTSLVDTLPKMVTNPDDIRPRAAHLDAIAAAHGPVWLDPSDGFSTVHHRPTGLPLPGTEGVDWRPSETLPEDYYAL